MVMNSHQDFLIIQHLSLQIVGALGFPLLPLHQLVQMVMFIPHPKDGDQMGIIHLQHLRAMATLLVIHRLILMVLVEATQVLSSMVVSTMVKDHHLTGIGLDQVQDCITEAHLLLMTAHRHLHLMIAVTEIQGREGLGNTNIESLKEGRNGLDLEYVAGNMAGHP